MKLGFHSYAVILPIEKRYIKFNNNNLNSLEGCNIAQNDISLNRVVQCLFQHNLRIPHHHRIQRLRQRKY
jgi:hypothetical protein